MVEDGIIKWVWGSLGLMICSIPVFFNLDTAMISQLGPAAAGSDSDMGGRTQGFVTNVSTHDKLSKVTSAPGELRSSSISLHCILFRLPSSADYCSQLRMPLEGSCIHIKMSVNWLGILQE